MPYVRRSFFAGEHFIDLADAQRRAECGARPRPDCGCTAPRCRPAEVFAARGGARSRSRRRALPYDLPLYATPKVHRDHHIEVAKALYSVPGNLIGRHVEVRADRQLVKIFFRGQLVKTHPRQAPGGRSTDPGRSARGQDRLRPARPRPPAVHGRRPRARHRRLRGGAARPPAAVDQDAPGLRPVGPGQEVGTRPGRRGLCQGGSRPRPSTSRSSAACSSGPPSPTRQPVPIQGRLLPARFVRPDADFAFPSSTRTQSPS